MYKDLKPDIIVDGGIERVVAVGGWGPIGGCILLPGLPVLPVLHPTRPRHGPALRVRGTGGTQPRVHPRHSHNHRYHPLHYRDYLQGLQDIQGRVRTYRTRLLEIQINTVDVNVYKDLR